MPRQEVYDFLDVLANHERFNDHLLKDWRFSGPPSGVGARAEARTNVPMSQESVEFEVIAAEPPHTIVEQSIGANGRRRTRGTYELEEVEGRGTRISFIFEWLEAPLNERIGAPLTRAFIRRANGRSMRRLAKELRADR